VRFESGCREDGTERTHNVNETLARALQSLEISGPVSHGLLHIFPLQGDTHAEQDIYLLEGALEAGTLHIEELHEAGSVPELRVVNEGPLRVLILEGDELIGAKQNRVVNSSVLVAAGSDLTLPVSCIERGRWSYRSRAFSPGTGSPHLALRRLETRSVHDSLRRGRGHRRDQRALWREVHCKARLHAAASPTHAVQASRSHRSERLDAFEKLARDLPEGTRGVVVAIGERLVLLEVLAGPRTFARVFRKLLSGYAFESVGLDRPYGTPDPQAVRSFMEAAAKAAHEEHQAVGAGRDVRFEEGGISGYALLGEEGVLHAAAFAG
jgi:ARG and Rhodanese-Phosphatase-superfamily-associated Protein domain